MMAKYKSEGLFLRHYFLYLNGDEGNYKTHMTEQMLECELAMY